MTVKIIETKSYPRLTDFLYKYLDKNKYVIDDYDDISEYKENKFFGIKYRTTKKIATITIDENIKTENGISLPEDIFNLCKKYSEKTGEAVECFMIFSSREIV